MKTVLLESPYAGDVEANIEYARRCMRDSLDRGEAPMLGHLLYTQVLDDNAPEERNRGIEAHMSWLGRCALVAVYIDYGVSPGMTKAIKAALGCAVPIELRTLEP